MSAKSIAKKAFKANAITEEEYKQLLCVIKLSDESLRQKGVLNAPTATFREVVAYECGQKSVERPTGHWITETTDDLPVPFEHLVCSNCKKEAIVDDWHCYVKSDFCPNCGADMRKEAEKQDV